MRPQPSRIISCAASRIFVFADSEALMEAAADRIAGIAGEAVARRGRFTWVLSGGATPTRLYRLLASERLASRFDWENVHFFWGDERCVPPDDPDSNYRMVREALLDTVHPPPGNVHRLRGEAEPTTAAADYEQELRGFFESGRDAPVPCFDLVLLGMGADGHTASLFPDAEALHDTTHWVMATRPKGSGMWRLTLTPLVINAAAHIVFLVTGVSKADRLAQAVRAGPAGTDVLPVHLIRATDGDLVWLVDAEAASRLDR